MSSPVDQLKARTMPKRVRTPNCTHVDMDRVYGQDLQCHVCGRVPSIGFLYECRQDRHSESLHDLLPQEAGEAKLTKSSLRSQLESIGLSESVILTAEAGHYTDAQLNKLKALKLELRQIISDVEQKSDINDAVARLTSIAKGSLHDASALEKDAVSGPRQRPQGVRLRQLHLVSQNESITQLQRSPGCTFKACHTCRPYYRDRIYLSFQSVLDAEFPPMTQDDVRHLPTKSSQIMRTIGNTVSSVPSSLAHATTLSTLPTSGSFATSTEAPYTASSSTTDSSELTFKTTQTDIDQIAAHRQPRRRFYRMRQRNSKDIARDLSRLPSFLTRQGLKSAVQGIFGPGRESSSSGSNVTLPLQRTGTVRDLNESQAVGEFDLGALRRVRRQKEKNEVRNGTYTGGFEGVNEGASAASHTVSASTHSHDGHVEEDTSCSESDYSIYSGASEGSEVEVEGGVALTEEAVETQTPDILAVDVPAEKLEAMVQSAELNGEDETKADIGLQSIMAQV
ncbi:hypothetical protein N0V83_010493 [Neocucurbitaria cava]|uniref:Uncharacterized protein n=1 Tax=Neocucurbitaria cava TaxID=798079 RepID=A0A9W9CHG5_9PLEO|nr:hypothetical protein N0V83_010493 [Neocucurbitaria cava]